MERHRFVGDVTIGRKPGIVRHQVIYAVNFDTVPRRVHQRQIRTFGLALEGAQRAEHSGLVQVRRRAVVRQIAGRGGDDAALQADAARDQAGILKHTNPQRQVDALFDQIREAVTKHQVHAQIRMQVQ
jgi:hypothetical protein